MVAKVINKNSKFFVLLYNNLRFLLSEKILNFVEIYYFPTEIIVVKIKITMVKMAQTLNEQT